jgi:ethanolamine utilization protein EutQ (cupin superfamily)
MNERGQPVQKLTADEAQTWSEVTDRIAVSDIVDQASAPEAEMTVGFARVGAGEALEISFPYDEVLILTKGAYTVSPDDGEPVTARPGEAIYLPAGSRNSSYAEEDSEMVYVASPPSVYAEHVAAAAAGA